MGWNGGKREWQNMRKFAGQMFSLTSGHLPLLTMLFTELSLPSDAYVIQIYKPGQALRAGTYTPICIGLQNLVYTCIYDCSLTGVSLLSEVFSLYLFTMRHRVNKKYPFFQYRGLGSKKTPPIFQNSRSALYCK